MCERGITTEVNIGGKSISIDQCIAADVDAINNVGHFRTLGSCCGHGVYRSTIVVTGGSGIHLEYYTQIIIPRKRNFYRRDRDGMYHLPELCKKVRE